jgi:hypothetical protein
LEPRNLVSELFTQGSVGGAAGNCCSYPATRPPKLHLIGASVYLLLAEPVKLEYTT